LPDGDEALFLIYTVLYSIALFFLLPFEFCKRPGKDRFRWVREKFGLVRDVEEGPIWVHAVSVGEVMAAVPFVKALAEKGRSDIVVSTITDTGQKVAIERLPGTRVFYMPFDLPSALKTAIRRVKPSAFIIVETELWPNAINVMNRFRVPVFLVNGRLSDGAYARRAVVLGAREGGVRVTGNFKFDMTPGGEPPFWLSMLHFPVIVAGSTHRGEEEIIASAAGRLMADFPSLHLVIVPRHPGRGEEAARALRAEGINYVFSSAIRQDSRIPCAVIVDTVGELFGIYSAADIAIVGGSFVPHGGQNPLEPAYWGKAVVCGPHMENFPFMEEMTAGGGALVVGGNALYGELLSLLRDEKRRQSLGVMARKFYMGKAGAVCRTVDAILPEVFPLGAL
jgi:3-deoxy-D-manno-octulosonic-acid transferase